MSPTPVTVVLAADQKFSTPLTVAARSVIDTIAEGRQLHLCILDMGIEPETRARIERSLVAPHVELQWVDSLGERVAHLPNTWTTITRATYARLYIPEVLDASVGRAIYLDCDTIVRHDISQLFDTPTDGMAVMGVPDCQSPFASSPWGHPFWFEAGRSPSDPNINAGMILMDLDVWRHEGLTDATLRYLTDGRHHFAQDQEAINVVLAGRIGLLDPRWNQQAELYAKEYEATMPYSAEVIARLKADPWITHYSNRGKPWHFGYEHPRVDEWFTVLDRTEFRGWRPKQSVVGAAKLAAEQARPMARRVARRLRLHT